jgi:cytochrome bd ubiquinol oxidase subunit II
MDYVVIAFLWLSILLYILLGGADFGAGIIEMFTSSRRIKRTRNTLYHAIGPIWEANHMWLIIAIVILFVGFPEIYSELSISLHIPLLIMLLGIIARGTAFVFRHYDAVRDGMQEIYNKIFVWSSTVTPFFLGIIAASTISGHIDPNATTFYERYMASWLNWFSFAVGLFTVALCGFLAAVYLVGEAENDDDRRGFIRKAKNANIIAVICGALVFVAAEIDHVPLTKWVFDGGVGLASVIAATLSLVLLWITIRSERRWLCRLLVAFQVTMILMAISYEHFPDFILLKDGSHFSLIVHQAPEITMKVLAVALLIGSTFILPALFYLYYSFQKKGPEPYSH